MESKRFHIPSLDGIRAISFLIVYLSHVGFGNKVPGGLGVTIFFFLSGYLITTLLRREWDKNGAIDIRAFFLRRSLRIFPPLYAALILAWIGNFLYVLPGQPTTEGLLALIFYYFNYHSIAVPESGALPGTDVYWSLSVEEHFYALFPFLFPVLCAKAKTDSGRGIALLITCALVLAWRFVLVMGFGVTEQRTYAATDTRIDSILFGCILAVWGNPVFDRDESHPRSRALLDAALAIAGAGLLLSTLVYRAPWFRETLRYTLQGIALIPLFIAATRYPHWWVVRPLNWKPIRQVGVLSYSLYLVHFMVVIAVARNVPGLTRATFPIVTFAICLLLSWGMHLAVERPALALKDRLSNRPRRTAEVPVA